MRIFDLTTRWKRVMGSFHKMSSKEFQSCLSGFPVDLIKEASKKGCSPMFIVNNTTYQCEQKIQWWFQFCQNNNILLDQQVSTSKYYKKDYNNTFLHEWLANENFDIAKFVLEKIISDKYDFDVSKKDAEGKTPLMLGLIVGAPKPVISNLLNHQTFNMGFMFSYNTHFKSFNYNLSNTAHQLSTNGVDESVYLSPTDVAFILGNHCIKDFALSSGIGIEKTTYCQLDTLTKSLLDSCSINPERGHGARYNILTINHFIFYLKEYKKNKSYVLCAFNQYTNESLKVIVPESLLQNVILTKDIELSKRYKYVHFFLNCTQNMIELIKLLKREKLYFEGLNIKDDLLYQLGNEHDLRKDELSCIEAIQESREAMMVNDFSKYEVSSNY